MARLLVTQAARDGLIRCRAFLAGKNPLAARRAAEAINRHLQLLTRYPEMGRPFDPAPEMRELLIPFGDGGYAALYRHDPARDAVILLAFRHQKEAGY